MPQGFWVMVGMAHGHGERLVPEELLHHIEVDASLNHLVAEVRPGAIEADISGFC